MQRKIKCCSFSWQRSKRCGDTVRTGYRNARAREGVGKKGEGQSSDGGWFWGGSTCIKNRENELAEEQPKSYLLSERSRALNRIAMKSLLKRYAIWVLNWSLYYCFCRTLKGTKAQGWRELLFADCARQAVNRRLSRFPEVVYGGGTRSHTCREKIVRECRDGLSRRVNHLLFFRTESNLCQNYHLPWILERGQCNPSSLQTFQHWKHCSNREREKPLARWFAYKCKKRWVVKNPCKDRSWQQSLRQSSSEIFSTSIRASQDMLFSCNALTLYWLKKLWLG